MSTPFTPPMPSLPPDSISGFGVLTRLRRNGFSAFPERCFREPVVSLRVPGKSLVLASGPEAMKALFIGQATTFRRLRMGRRVLGPIVGDGILVSEGVVWRERRKAMAPAFTPRAVAALTPHIAASTEKALQTLHDDGVVDIFAFMQILALDIAAVTMFSMASERFNASLREMVTSFMAGIGRPRPADFLLPQSAPTVTDWRRARFRKRWVRLVEAIIAERPPAAAVGKPRDLFDLLVAALGVNGASQRPEVIDEVGTMIVAGHETTATALFWSVWLLAHAEDWRKMAADEVLNVDLSPDNAAANLENLPVVTAIVREALRLFPPAFMTGREAVEDAELCGQVIKRGAIVLTPFWMLHRSPTLWSQPNAFDPGRFLRGPEPDRFAYLPFGVGPHVCIGAQLAMAEAVFVLARLLQRYHVAVCDDRPVLPVGVLSTRPSRAPAFRLTRRRVSR
ncbi:cytochrome P450 [Acetobacter sacchari]|uniref:Cytochrome P450 n=1 Tax=Acetobacter sacchari TaxID=2661687 RepID=A0ABS3LVQ2_9PROT|nr:cytochrome P450 [Acetobacter sacchari]MBO1359941.1 cytochrome P450 [Acetobacter sacchari]